MHAPGLLVLIEAAAIMANGMELFLLFMHARHLQTLISTVSSALRRLNIQEASLLRARHDQEALIAKLTDSATAHTSN